jgi:hypothetical protein
LPSPRLPAAQLTAGRWAALRGVLDKLEYSAILI